MSFFNNADFSWALLFRMIAWQILKDMDLVFNNHIKMPCSMCFSINNCTTKISKRLGFPNDLSNLHKKGEPNCQEEAKPGNLSDHATQKLNPDGNVHHHTCNAACGGLIKDCNGNIIQGFTNMFSQGYLLRVELWGVLKGLRLLTYDLGPRKIKIELDSKEAL